MWQSSTTISGGGTRKANWPRGIGLLPPCYAFTIQAAGQKQKPGVETNATATDTVYKYEAANPEEIKL